MARNYLIKTTPNKEFIQETRLFRVHELFFSSKLSVYSNNLKTSFSQDKFRLKESFLSLESKSTFFLSISD